MNPSNRPFVVDFLYAYSLPRRPNLAQLIEWGIIPGVDDMPRGFRKIDWELFTKLARYCYTK